MALMDRKNKYAFMRSQHFLLCLVIILIVVVVTIINPRFIAVNNLLAIFQQISVLGILTMAMGLLLIGGVIDLSIGNIMVVSGVVMSLMVRAQMNSGASIAACILVGIVCGVMNGFVVAYSKCIPLIITLGTSQIFYGIALTLTGGRIMSFGGTLDALGKSRIFDVFPVMLFVLIFVIVVAAITINYTKYGRRVVAMGSNEKNAFLSGIPVIRYKVILYAIGGLFSGTAAIVFCSRIDSITANAGTGYDTRALTAAIIGGITFEGGKGTISGAFLGCLLMGVINNAMNILGVTTYVQTIITGIIIVAAVVLSNVNNLRRK